MDNNKNSTKMNQDALAVVYPLGNYVYYIGYTLKGEVVNVVTTDLQGQILYNRNEDLKQSLNIE